MAKAIKTLLLSLKLQLVSSKSNVPLVILFGKVTLFFKQFPFKVKNEKFAAKPTCSMHLFGIFVIVLHVGGIVKWFLWIKWVHPSNIPMATWKYIFMSFLLVAVGVVAIGPIVFTRLKKETVFSKLNATN